MNVAKEIENIKELLENNIQQKSAISSDTKKSIAVLEVNYKNIMDEFKNFQRSNKDSHESILQAVKDLQYSIDSALEKKAGKWVETVIYWFAKIIGGGLITFLGYQIVKLINIQ